jgi:hypothetical protein
MEYVFEAGSSKLKEIIKNQSQLFEDLTDIINKLDPVRISMAGRYEYEYEVADILVHLPLCKTEKDVRDLVIAVFSEWFDPGFGEPLKEGEYALEILSLARKHHANWNSEDGRREGI